MTDFSIVEKLSEELGDKEERIMELENELEYQKQEKMKYWKEMIVLQWVSEFYKTQNDNTQDSIIEVIDYFYDKFNKYGDIKYDLYILSLEYVLSSTITQSIYDEDEIRKEYEEAVKNGFNPLDDEFQIDVHDIVEWFGSAPHEDHDGKFQDLYFLRLRNNEGKVVFYDPDN